MTKRKGIPVQAAPYAVMDAGNVTIHHPDGTLVTHDELVAAAREAHADYTAFAAKTGDDKMEHLADMIGMDPKLFSTMFGL